MNNIKPSHTCRHCKREKKGEYFLLFSHKVMIIAATLAALSQNMHTCCSLWDSRDLGGLAGYLIVNLMASSMMLRCYDTMETYSPVTIDHLQVLMEFIIKY